MSTFDDLLAQEYPQFSQVELARRRALIEEAMAVADVDHLLCYGIGTRGGAIGWLSQWVVTNEAQLVLTPR